MKLSFKILASVLILSFGLTACLKDKDYDNGLIQSVHNDGNTNQKIIEIQLTATSTDNFLFTAFDAVSHDTTIAVIPVVLASREAATEDINVTLVARPSLVNDYNTNNGTAYAVPPASMYTILNQNNVVTIPKGSRVGYLMVKLKTADFLGQDWALGFAIASVDKPGYLISGNLNEGIFAFGIKNKWDGHYKMTGTLVDLAVPTITAQSPIEVDLETYSGNSVILNPTQGPFAGGYLFPIINSGAPSGYGSFTPVFVFDANDNVVDVVNAYGQPASNTRSAQLDPSGINKWFASDKHMDVKFWMNQPSVIAGHRTSFDLHFTYLGPR
jgi:hypothetical protein